MSFVKREFLYIDCQRYPPSSNLFMVPEKIQRLRHATVCPSSSPLSGRGCRTGAVGGVVLLFQIGARTCNFPVDAMDATAVAYEIVMPALVCMDARGVIQLLHGAAVVGPRAYGITPGTSVCRRRSRRGRRLCGTNSNKRSSFW